MLGAEGVVDLGTEVEGRFLRVLRGRLGWRHDEVEEVILHRCMDERPEIE